MDSITSALEYGIGFCLVATCWGLTNPFIKRGSEGLEKIKRGSALHQALAQAWFLLTKWDYLLPLAINLSGSAVYYYFLGKADISLAVPITNSLTFVFTVIGGKFLGEKIGSLDTLLGMALIVLGVTLCVMSKP